MYIKSANIAWDERCVILVELRKYTTNLSHCVIKYTTFVIQYTDVYKVENWRKDLSSTQRYSINNVFSIS